MLGIDDVAWVLSKLIGEPCVGREDRAITIKLAAYVICCYNPDPDPDLHHNLIGLFTRQMYLIYKDLGIVQNISEYKRLLLPTLFYVIGTRPIQTSVVLCK